MFHLKNLSKFYLRNYKKLNFYFLFKSNLMEQVKTEVKAKTAKVRNIGNNISII
jgi:hypothetical protein